jgi:DNA polymerase-3 subunit epsilon
VGLTTRPAETLLTERALELLARGPAHAVPLIEYVCQMPGAPKVVAEQMALALFADRPEFTRDDDGRWQLAEGAVVPPVALPMAPVASRQSKSAARRLEDLTYAVIDVETTGMMATGGDRITEIAVVVVRDGRLAETFGTLINPDRPIPPFITSLTHISWDMVKDAPRFADIVDDLLQVMKGHVFVAHNADFDWRFVRAEVERATGRRLTGPKLCTVKLARRVLPHLPSRRLDALSHHYGVTNEARHRAMGDAAATAEILLRLLGAARDRECQTWADLQTFLGARARGNRPSRLSGMPGPVRDDGSA